jgi:hypothetical protein
MRVLHQIGVQREKSAIEVATLCLGLPEAYCDQKFKVLYMPTVLAHTRRETTARPTPSSSDSSPSHDTNEADDDLAEVSDDAVAADAADDDADDNSSDGGGSGDRNSAVALLETGTAVRLDRLALAEHTIGGGAKLTMMEDYLSRGPQAESVGLFDYVRRWRRATKKSKPVTLSAEGDGDGKGCMGGGGLGAVTVTVVAEPLTDWFVPHIIGPRIPKQQSDEERWCHYVLTLFKPWRKATDLRTIGERWSEAYERWRDSGEMQPEALRYLDNLQAMHDGQSRQQAERDQRLRDGFQRSVLEQQGGGCFDGYGSNNDDDDDGGSARDAPLPLFARDPDYKEALLFVGQSSESDRYALAAVHSLQIAGGTRIYRPMAAADQDPNEWVTDEWTQQPLSRFAAGRTASQQLAAWVKEAKELKRRIIRGENADDDESDAALDEGEDGDLVIGPANTVWQTLPAAVVLAMPVGATQPSLIEMADAWTLNPEQRACFYRIGRHFLDKLGGKDVKPLRMFVTGPGGTGKTRVIHALQQLFKNHKKSKVMRLAAFCGSAARAIRGRTLHGLFQLGRNRDALSLPCRTALVKNFKEVDYVVVDEVGTVSQQDLERISHRCVIAKELGDSGDEFGGMSFIFMGDFLQHKPVAGTALHTHSLTDHRSLDAASPGRKLWEGMSDCFFFNRQERQKSDVEYLRILDHLRRGEGSLHDYEVLSELVISPDRPLPASFQDAQIITPRNSVRLALNLVLAEKFAAAHHHRLVTVLACDTSDGKPIEFCNEANILYDLPENLTGKCCGKLPLCPGLPLMLNTNIHVELGLVNGAQGCFYGFVWGSSGPPVGVLGGSGSRSSPIFLHRLPLAILVRFDGATFQLENLPQGVAPIHPTTSNFVWKPSKGGPVTVHRKSFPLTPAFAITDYNAQGRTMSPVIIDLDIPPDRKVGFATTYVQLSRPRGKEYVRILRSFAYDPVLRWQPPPSIARDERGQRCIERRSYRWLVKAGFAVAVTPPSPPTPSAQAISLSTPPAAPATVAVPQPQCEEQKREVEMHGLATPSAASSIGDEECRCALSLQSSPGCVPCSRRAASTRLAASITTAEALRRAAGLTDR